jgi:hypothetical protein
MAADCGCSGEAGTRNEEEGEGQGSEQPRGLGGAELLPWVRGAGGRLAKGGGWGLRLLGGSGHSLFIAEERGSRDGGRDFPSYREDRRRTSFGTSVEAATARGQGGEVSGWITHAPGSSTALLDKLELARNALPTNTRHSAPIWQHQAWSPRGQGLTMPYMQSKRV